MIKGFQVNLNITNTIFFMKSGNKLMINPVILHITNTFFFFCTKTEEAMTNGFKSKIQHSKMKLRKYSLLIFQQKF